MLYRHIDYKPANKAIAMNLTYNGADAACIFIFFLKIKTAVTIHLRPNSVVKAALAAAA